MELHFLGTGAGLPSKNRNVSAVALSLLQELNSVWLFDCGEATQHQILHTSIKPKKINKIFITHLHGDHIFGLPGLLSSRSFQGGDEACTIYGPVGIQRFIETSLETSCTHLTYPLHIVEFSEGELFENDKFLVDCIKLDHGIPSYGFRIIEKDRPGELLVDRLIEVGIKPGPIYRKIKENEWVTLDNGQVIHQADFIGEKKRGKKIVIFGDTRNPEKHKLFIQGADILVHEATFGHDKQDLANKYFHSTTTEVATVAKDSNIKKLVLTHVSSRYQKEDDRQLLTEAQDIFPNTVLANDFYRLSIK